MKINSEKVISLRAKKHWSQEKLSEACGLSLRTIQRLESSGKASIESVKALAFVFDVDRDALILVEKDEQLTPDKQLTPLNVVKACFVKFADFSGTATRYEYWWFFLFALLTTAVAEIIHPALLQIVTIILLLPLSAVGTRRLNDAGQSGWWQLLALVPFGIVVVLYMMTIEKCDLDVAQPPKKQLDTA